MNSFSNEIESLDQLREFVYGTLCEDGLFEPGVFPMTEQILVRGGRPCGIHFCLHGPRQVRFSAIWETDRNSVLFYGSSGQRIHKTQLVESSITELVTDEELAAA